MRPPTFTRTVAVFEWPATNGYAASNRLSARNRYVTRPKVRMNR